MDNKKNKIDSFSMHGLIMSGMILLSNETMKIVNMDYPNSKVIPAAAACFVGGVLLDSLFAANEEYNNLFRMCGIENKDGKVPLVIKKEKKGKTTTLVFHMPPGISQKSFEEKQEQLEQYFNSKIEFGFNKNLIMKMTEMNLKTMYPFLFEECEKPLEVYCGETHFGKFVLDVEKCPHIIVAGETGGGKTSFVDILVLALMMNKYDIDLHLHDFQRVGLGIFENCKKVKSYGESPEDFEKLMDEMEKENERRLKMFVSMKNKFYVEKLSVWNKKFPDKAMPYKVVVVDEFAALADDRFKPILEKFRTRASMDRKTGIHYIICMQRPDVKCIEGSIKANMPTRIAFKTVTETDSKVILDLSGAQKLKNAGRFLAKYCGELQEVQSMYIEPEDVRKFLKQYKLCKTRDELKAEKQAERKNIIDEYKKKNLNPYRKEVSS